jgi:hypothetical protein
MYSLSPGTKEAAGSEAKGMVAAVGLPLSTQFNWVSTRLLPAQVPDATR